MKKYAACLLAICLVAVLSAQGVDDMLFMTPRDSTGSDIISINFAKKDARLAMLYSAVLPGAGQFYADPSAFTTYLFPALEAALIGGIVYFNVQGDRKTTLFENYATEEVVDRTFHYTVNGIDYDYTYVGPRYNRTYQSLVQTVLMNVNAFDIYDGTFFRLDGTNTQHFYEDIGKYNKYIFGWADWYHNFASDPRSPSGAFILDQAAFSDAWVYTGSTDPQLVHQRRWDRNYRIEDFLNGDLTNPIAPGNPDASPFRAEYINMRKAANKEYSYARYFTLGLAFNHIASAVEASMLTARVNRQSITSSPLRLQYFATLRDGGYTPGISLSMRF